VTIRSLLAALRRRVNLAFRAMLDGDNRGRPADAVVSSGPTIPNPARVKGLNHAGSVHPTAGLFVRSHRSGEMGSIDLGRNVYLGPDVELAAWGDITIGDETSIQKGCIIHGDVRIGAYCLFGPYIHVGSTIHRFRDRPEWLIRDQDTLAAEQPDVLVSPASNPIAIEDDCWLGWSVVIMPGAYVGRGAVVGANCVVTRDIGPYEVHGGVPNRKIGERLAFSPPRAIRAEQDLGLPYFYRGFRVDQKAVRSSRQHGVIEATASAVVVLAGSSGEHELVRLVCVMLDESIELNVYIKVNGAPCGQHRLCEGETEIRVEFPLCETSKLNQVPAPHRGYTYVEIESVWSDAEGAKNRPPRYGLSSAMLIPRAQ
jgi:acetyltransferase-like isoleucine patch superfamily enzyme